MIVEQIWTGNAYRNFNYLIVCPDTGEAMAIDPLDHEKCLNTAKDRGWDITQVLNTHEHGDNTASRRTEYGHMVQLRHGHEIQRVEHFYIR